MLGYTFDDEGGCFGLDNACLCVDFEWVISDYYCYKLVTTVMIKNRSEIFHD